MQQTHTFKPLATAPAPDSAHATEPVDAFDTAMTVLRNAGVEFVVLDEAAPMERAA